MTRLSLDAYLWRVRLGLPVPRLAERTDNVRSFTEYLERKRAEHGAKFDPSDLAPQFVRWWESGERIEVCTLLPDGSTTHVRRGRVGVTTGWRPAFLLLSRRGVSGSSDVLGANDAVARVIPDRKGR